MKATLTSSLVFAFGILILASAPHNAKGEEGKKFCPGAVGTQPKDASKEFCDGACGEDNWNFEQCPSGVKGCRCKNSHYRTIF